MFMHLFVQGALNTHGLVAKRKTLFDDRPVEISVRVPLDVHLSLKS